MGIHRFLRRAWTLVTSNKDEGIRDTIPQESEEKEVVRAINLAIKRVTSDLEEMGFNTAISALMEFVNSVNDKKLSKETLERFTLLLAPLAPHLSEELWERLGHATSLSTEAFPAHDESALAVESVNVVIQVNGKKRALIEVPISLSEDALKALVIERMGSTEFKVSEKDRYITVFQPGTKTPKLVNVISQ